MQADNKTDMIVERVWSVSFEKCFWIVKDAIVSGGAHYVSLPRRKPSCCTFARMCCKDSQENYSLVASIGYKELAQLRNRKQAEYMANGGEPEAKVLPQGQSDLKQLFAAQRDSEFATPVKRPSMTRSRMREVRQQKELLEVVIPAFDSYSEMQVSMMRPAHPSEDIVVPLDAKVISRIVEFIRFKGFDMASMRPKRDPRLPKGVWARRAKNGKVKFFQKKIQDEGSEQSRLRKVSIEFEDDGEDVEGCTEGNDSGVEDDSEPMAGMPMAEPDRAEPDSLEG